MTSISRLLIDKLAIGESVIVTSTVNGKPLRGQGDVTSFFVRCKPKQFVSKTMALVDSTAMTIERAVLITRTV